MDIIDVILKECLRLSAVQRRVGSSSLRWGVLTMLYIRVRPSWSYGTHLGVALQAGLPFRPGCLRVPHHLA